VHFDNWNADANLGLLAKLLHAAGIQRRTACLDVIDCYDISAIVAKHDIGANAVF